MKDSRTDTWEHIHSIQRYLKGAIDNLMTRAWKHDQSKLVAPEKDIFDEYTPKLKYSTYGSEEYQGFLKEMKVALDHHYSRNDHHPEFFENGVRGMSLLSLLEMLCDWKAATLRHLDGDILISIEKNQKRFGYSDEVKEILLNTVKELDMC